MYNSLEVTSTPLALTKSDRKTLNKSNTNIGLHAEMWPPLLENNASIAPECHCMCLVVRGFEEKWSIVHPFVLLRRSRQRLRVHDPISLAVLTDLPSLWTGTFNFQFACQFWNGFICVHTCIWIVAYIIYNLLHGVCESVSNNLGNASLVDTKTCTFYLKLKFISYGKWLSKVLCNSNLQLVLAWIMQLCRMDYDLIWFSKVKFKLVWVPITQSLSLFSHTWH